MKTHAWMISGLLLSSAAAATPPLLEGSECGDLKMPEMDRKGSLRHLDNHHGWTADITTAEVPGKRGKREKVERITLRPHQLGSETFSLPESVALPHVGGCRIFGGKGEAQPVGGQLGPPGGTAHVRVVREIECGDGGCADMLVGSDSSGVARCTVAFAGRVTRLEPVRVFAHHDSVLVTIEADAGAGLRRVTQVVVHDSGQGLTPLVAAEIGSHEALAPTEKKQNKGLTCWRAPVGWIKVERTGDAPIIEALEPRPDSENGEGLGTGGRARWEWSAATHRFEQTGLSKHPYDARAPCRKKGGR